MFVVICQFAFCAAVALFVGALFGRQTWNEVLARIIAFLIGSIGLAAGLALLVGAFWTDFSSIRELPVVHALNHQLQNLAGVETSFSLGAAVFSLIGLTVAFAARQLSLLTRNLARATTALATLRSRVADFEAQLNSAPSQSTKSPDTFDGIESNPSAAAANHDLLLALPAGEAFTIGDQRRQRRLSAQSSTQAALS